ncbi:MAG TPA: hypothetical protein VNU66_07085 [Mycobacteriales bacterium]|nr:hypothetical protein [Mycobacteriales bacterium]
MRRPLLLAAAVALVLPGVGLAASTPAAPPPAPFLVGTAAVSTDPPEPYDGSICIGGYGAFCTRAMTRVEDPMLARAVAVTGEAGAGDTAIVVTTTSIGLFAAYKDEHGGGNGIYDIRQEVARRLPVPATHVVVQSDHSHAGPDVIGLWGGVPQWWMELQREAVVEAAVQAYERRRPAHLRVASVQGPPTTSSYSFGTNTERDDEFRLLVADAPDGERLLTLVNYSPHATVLGSSNRDGTSGDWTAWAAQEAEALYGGAGMGAVGSIGSTDWNKVSGSQDDREAEARQRLRTLLAQATAALEPVRGSTVGVQSTFLREQLAQPVLAANFLPGIVGLLGQGELRIDRATTPPWYSGGLVGTYAGALRLGDLFVAVAPGEVFPRVNRLLRESVEAQDHLFLGAANDFLGYMTESEESYLQTLQEGATFLAGCPEEALIGGDPACPDHWTLMVSPTIGAHVLCTVQEAAAALGMPAAPGSRCPALTALDGVAAPPEEPGKDGGAQDRRATGG